MKRLQSYGFDYVVRYGGQPNHWAWEVYRQDDADDPIVQGTFKGSEGRAHMAARDAISRLRERRVAR